MHEEYSSSDLENVFGICGGGLLTLIFLLRAQYQLRVSLGKAGRRGGADDGLGSVH